MLFLTFCQFPEFPLTTIKVKWSPWVDVYLCNTTLCVFVGKSYISVVVICCFAVHRWHISLYFLCLCRINLHLNISVIIIGVLIASCVGAYSRYCFRRMSSHLHIDDLVVYIIDCALFFFCRLAFQARYSSQVRIKVVV